MSMSLKSYENVCKNKDFCGTVMLSQKDNILQLSQYMKSEKMLYMIYADLESLIKKVDGCANNPQKSSTTKMGKHIPCGYLTSTICAFDHIENKHTLY